MTSELVRNQPGVRLTVSELIAAIALVITLVSGLNGWIVLPEQMRVVKEENIRQNTRLDAVENGAQQQALILARIDERTKRIEEAIRTVHPQVQ
jgi:uncharacterized protein HemX